MTVREFFDGRENIKTINVITNELKEAFDFTKMKIGNIVGVRGKVR
jgi:hypothetical protein